MKILIAYYSKTGGTEKLAYFLKNLLEKKRAQVDIQKIEPKKERSLFDWFFLSLFKKETPIKKPKILDLKKYDRILIGTPNWARLSLPIGEFLREAKGLERKFVCLFSTTYLPSIFNWFLLFGFFLEKTIQNVLSQKKAKLLSSLFLQRNNFNKDKIEKFTREVLTSVIKGKKFFENEKKNVLREFILLTDLGVLFLFFLFLFSKISFLWIGYGLTFHFLLVLSYLKNPKLGDYIFATGWLFVFFELFCKYPLVSSYIFHFIIIFLTILLFFRNPFLILYTLSISFLSLFFEKEYFSFEKEIFLLIEGSVLIILAFILRDYHFYFWKFFEFEQEEKIILEIRLAARTKHLKEEREKLAEEVKKRTKKLFETSERLKERVKELEKFYKLTIGREIKIKELKRKIKNLEEELKKYESS